MKPTATTEKEILQVYDTWLHSYLTGDVITYDRYLDQEYHFIGSTNNEEFLPKKETTQFFQETAEQLAGKTDLRNERKVLEEFQGLIFITHFFDAWFLNDTEWAYYGRFRFSSVARRNADGWRFIYQHFSTPDIKAQEGETIGYDQISAENLELREAIRRRTKELENKNRELEIEAALERVRAKSMAMYKSEELAGLSLELVKQVQALGVETWFCAFNIYDDDPQGSLEWGSNGQGTFPEYRTPREGVFLRYYRAGQEGETLLINEIDDKTCPAHYEYLCSLPGVGEQLLKMKDAGIPFPTSQIDHVAYFKYGYILFITYEPVPESHGIFKRFAKAFEQTYTRFLDLKKAEQQVREARINLGVERVRAASLAMHKSEDIMNVVAKLKDEMMSLDIPDVAAATIFLKEADGKIRMWDLTSIEKQEDGFQVPLDIVFTLKKRDPHLYIKRVWENPTDYFIETQNEKGLMRITEWLREHDQAEFAREVEQYVNSAGIKMLYHATQKLNNGKLCVDVLSHPTEEMEMILSKMGAAFDLAYQRFEDLQKAEAQAREAQIELGLERVRTRAMGMQHSSELSDLVDTLFQELTKLDFALAWCIINIIDEPSLTNMVWAANPETNKPPESYQMKFEDYPFHHSMMKGYQERKTKHVYVIEGEEKEAYDEYLFNKTEWSRVPKAAQAASRAMKRYVATFTFSNFGGLQTVGEDHLSEENLEILSRFGKVFDLTYTRFNDLKKAEIQAREARIEHALEKVRSRTMAMQHSDELPEAANVLFMEIQALGIPAWSCGYNILASDNRSATCCMSSEGTLQKPFKLRLWGESSFEEMGDFVRCNESFLLQELGGTAIKEHYDHMKSFPDLLPTFEAIEKQGLSLPTYQINHLCKFKQGFLLFITYEPVPQAHDLFKRFTTVFEQTYTRFLDLQQAEARARESQIETALERVRSRTMGMQKSDELGDVATVLFKELNKLVDNLWTCGFVLCEEGRDEDEWWLSAENGFIPAFYLPNVGDVTHANIYNAWKNGADYHTEQLEGEALQEHYDWLMNIPVAKKIFDDMRASGIEIPTWQKLHCAFFKTGYLVIITEVPCPEEEIFKRFAQAFDLTYTRFLDLQLKETQARKLAEDKEQLERTLSDLRTTQAQLIQSEKMASLGELTAGIAHEIQNPLNFVNNFSEVSKELIEEMLEEMQNGDIEEVKALAEDIIQNLEKIHHHGQRADGIVKGMLQHSRSGGGEKEPTDINVLADEYLRLAYHGLRAKDKSFNASLETYFDPALGKVNVVAQDMGRVILNLITNAFYVVKERKEKEGEGYSPTVTVTTRKNKNGVEITVKDNGNGIPDHIRDKIFQPFFTTKPAGQGTGLGLSMSYEIVTKGHNGELKVTSKEGVGTTFTIILPIGIKKN